MIESVLSRLLESDKESGRVADNHAQYGGSVAGGLLQKHALLH
jgi:hypothetical protein